MQVFLRKYAARLAGIIFGGIAGFLVNQGIAVAPEDLEVLRSAITELTVVATMIGYSAIHVWIDHIREGKDG